MSNTIEGTIEDVRKSKPSQKYPECCTFSIKINGEYYQVFAGLKRESAFRVGDRVKLTYTEEEFNGMPQYKFKMDSFENLTNPIANNKKGNGNWKAQDPETSIRIANQSQIAIAKDILIHNSQGQVIKLEQLFKLTSQLVDFIYSNKPTSAPQPAQTSPKADNPPVDAYNQQPIDDDVPF